MPFPVPFDDRSDWLTSRQIAKAERAQADAGLAIYQHALQAHVRSEFDCLDSQAAADASSFSLEKELAFLDNGMEMAGQSPLRMNLVAHRLSRLVATNDRRLSRHFR